jgi:hypothetical protein
MSEIEIEISSDDVGLISVPVTTVDVPIIGGPAQLSGWSLRETTGTAVAIVQLLSGVNLLASLAIPSNGSLASWLGKDGIPAQQGIRLHVVSGSAEGAIYARYARP